MSAPRRCIGTDGREWADASGVIYKRPGKCRFCGSKLVLSASLVTSDGWRYWYCEGKRCAAVIGRADDVDRRAKIGRWR